MPTGLSAQFAPESTKVLVSLVVLTGQANKSLVTTDPRICICREICKHFGSLEVGEKWCFC